MALNTMNQLPLNLVITIFSKATLKTLIQCRRVCKSWLAALSDKEILRSSIKLPKCLVIHGNPNDTNSSANIPRSLHLYDHRDIPSADNAVLKLAAKTNDPKSVFTHLVGFCNGLLCWCRRDDTAEAGLYRFTIYITNPLTGESMTIPAGTNNPYRSLGFGFVPSKKQYKLVSLVTKKSSGELEAKVQTIGSGIWKCIKCPYEILHPRPCGIYANRALHWIAGNKIYSFDLETDQFGMLPSPPVTTPLKLDDVVVIKDRVTVWTNDGWEVWMMMEYGVESSWVRLKARNFDKKLGRKRWDPTRLLYEGPLIFYPEKKSLVLCLRYAACDDLANWGRQIYVHEHKRNNSLVTLPFTKVKEALPGFVPTFLSIKSLLEGAST